MVSQCMDLELCRLLEERGYLAQGGLDPLEAAFQASRGKLELEGLGGGWRAALAAADAAGLSLKELIVYIDLRRRGRLPRRGLRPGTFEYRAGGRLYEVLILEEGETTTYGRLLDWSRSAVADDREPVIAIVDRNGDVTYYLARATRSIS